jgi:hypothetical protein
MRSVSSWPIRLLVGMLSIAIGVFGSACKDTTHNDKPAGDQRACADAGDAAKDFQSFLQNYPSQPAVANIALANMQSSLTQANHEGPSSAVANAIGNAQLAIDTIQQAIDNSKPVDSGPLSAAMDDLGNACSQVLGG